MVEVINVIPPSPYKRPRFVAAVTPAERLKVREMHRNRGESKIQGPKRKVKEGEIVSFKFNKAQASKIIQLFGVLFRTQCFLTLK